MTNQEVIEQAKKSLSIQEAKVVLLMRELPYQTILISMENGKVVNKKRTESIKD